MAQNSVQKLMQQAKDFLNQLEQREFLLYAGIFLSLFLLAFGSMIYLSRSRTQKYTAQLKKLENERITTEKLLSEQKALALQKKEMEDILQKDPNFFIGKTYQDILGKVGLEHNQDETPIPTEGELFEDTKELILRSKLEAISMKKLTDLLESIAEVPRLYTKDIVIRKPGPTHTIDVELTLATLEKRG